MPYMHPKMNSSAPTLSLMYPEMAPRLKTTPAMMKRKTFAANLSMYDTFSPVTYDHCSEPSTCNQLTPALAQQIKEELNTYKMEEMEVHHVSHAQLVTHIYSTCMALTNLIIHSIQFFV